MGRLVTRNLLALHGHFEVGEPSLFAGTAHFGRADMIIRKDQAPADRGTEEHESLPYSDAGGLTQFGAYVETLRPGARSSDRHWHEEQDEFLYVISGEATVIEDDGAHPLYPGDAACWPAGAANAHQVVNHSDAPCTFLIFGTRMARDVVHYPEAERILRDEDGRWQLLRADDGSLITGGEIDQFRPMTWQGPGDDR
jgi:uncharacterized cupin superfamily protein